MPRLLEFDDRNCAPKCLATGCQLAVGDLAFTQQGQSFRNPRIVRIGQHGADEVILRSTQFERPRCVS